MTPTDIAKLSTLTVARDIPSSHVAYMPAGEPWYRVTSVHAATYAGPDGGVVAELADDNGFVVVSDNEITLSQFALVTPLS